MRNKITKKLVLLKLVLLFFLGTYISSAQEPLFEQVLVSDNSDFGNSIGSANTSRNVGVDEQGNIYVAYSSTSGIRVSKSIDRGQSFLPSVVVNVLNAFPEIVVTDDGIIYIAWISSDGIYLSKSTDEGETFSSQTYVGDGFGVSPHMAAFGNNVYIVDQGGQYTYSNSTNGVGNFTRVTMPKNDVYADVRVDKNGVVYAPSDDPTLFLSKSTNNGQDFDVVNLSSVGSVYFSSYALSDGPAGTFIFVGGGSDFEPGSSTVGYKINVVTGVGERITLGNNNMTFEGRTLYADSYGALIDGYLDDTGNLVISVSYDQGSTFPISIDVAKGESHNIDRNPKYDDVNVVYEQNGKIYMNVYDGLLRGVRIPDYSNNLQLCDGEVFELPYVLSGNFSPTSEFVSYLSDENGNFENKKFLGKVTSNTDGTIESTIPIAIPNGGNYRIQIQSLANFIQSNIIDVTIGGDIVALQPDDMLSCSLDTGEALFDLITQDDIIKNGKTSAVVSYFESKENAESNLNPIIKANEYEILTDKTIWVRLETGKDSKCPSFDITSFDLNIETLTIDESVYKIYSCSDEVNAIYDLTENESVISTNPELVFSYYESQADVDAELKIADPTKYESSILNNTILVLVENTNKCVATTSLELITTLNASYNKTPLPLEVCDNDNDGFEKFNLLAIENDILNGLTASDHDFYFYETLTEAQLGSDENIKNPSDFLNTLKEKQTIYAQVRQVTTTCFTIIPFEIVVNISPILALKPSNLIGCRNANGLSFFDLSVQDNIIINGQADTEISYYVSELDAINKNNRILDPTNYEAGNTAIWARLETFGNTSAFLCPGFDVVSFDLELKTPLLNQPTEISLCSDTIKTIYDLTVRELEIIDEQNTSFTYYETQEDLTNGIAIVSPENYESDSLTKTIFILVTDANNCFAQTNLILTTTINVAYNMNPNALEECDLDNDGYDEFDLSGIETDILNGLLPISDYSFKYYENITDAQSFNNNDIKSINNFTNTINTSQIIYAAIQQGNTECYQVVQFEIKVNKSPDPKIESTYSLCLDNNDQVISSATSNFETPLPIDTGLNNSEYEFKWYTGVDVVAGNQIDGENQHFYSPQRAGVYTVLVINKITRCLKKATTEVIGSYPPVSIMAEVISLPFAKNNKISVSVEGKGDYEYKINDGEWQLNSLFTRVSEGKHTIFVRDYANCDVMSDMALVIDSPDFFTPNGDGINEFWKIENVGNPNSVFVYIYDRFGKLVSQVTPGSQGWNGEFDGTPLPVDEYWFLLEYRQVSDNVLRQVKGHFSLIR